ncbi:DUF6371 domain-containing protein [Phocaeicola sp.]
MNYMLESYKGRSSRYTCPKCGQPHCFTRYIDTWTGQYLADDVGICDHKNSCGYHKPPREYFKERGSGYYSEYRQSYSLNRFTESSKERETDFIPMRIIEDFEKLNKKKNTLKEFLSGVFPLLGLQQVFSDYHIGTTKNGETVFPQIDMQGRCRTAKIMAYDESGHRIKGKMDRIDWLHARIMKKKGLKPSDWNLKQCLFGEHLLSSRPDDKVCLVESEKTAIICKLRCPEYLWLACGGKQNLKPEMCQALAGRNVLLCPDADAVANWEEQSKLLSFCRKTEMVRWYKHEAEDSKRDIADIILERLQKEAQDKVQETA